MGTVLTREQVNKVFSGQQDQSTDGVTKTVKEVNQLLVQGKEIVSMILNAKAQFTPNDSLLNAPKGGAVQPYQKTKHTEMVEVAKPIEIDKQKLATQIDDLMINWAVKLPKDLQEKPLKDFIGENWTKLEVNHMGLTLRHEFILSKLVEAIAQTMENCQK